MVKELTYSDLSFLEQTLGLLEDNSVTNFVLEENPFDLLSEGVYKSYNSDDLIKILVKNYNFGVGTDFYTMGYECGVWGVEYNKGDDFVEEVIVLNICVPEDYQNFDKIKKFMEMSGWTLAGKQSSFFDNSYYIYRFEKNRQVLELEKPQYLYHLTPLNRLNKILKNGLSPHAGNKKSVHPERIYFLVRPIQDDLITNFANALWKHGMLSKLKNNGYYRNANRFVNLFQRDVPYVLLKIDTNKCKNLKIYGDPNLHTIGAWTYDNVPPQAIEVLKTDI